MVSGKQCTAGSGAQQSCKRLWTGTEVLLDMVPLTFYMHMSLLCQQVEASDDI